MKIQMEKPMNRRFLLIAAACATAFAPAAFADDDISKNLVSNPNEGWSIYGAQTNKTIKDSTVQGGMASEVNVPHTGGNNWDASAQVNITRKVIKGDKIVAAVWLKSKTDTGAAATLHMRLQVNAAPYSAYGEQDVTVGSDWKLYSLEAKADQDYSANTSVLVIHLNTGKQTIDLGPAFVLDMGQ